MDGGGESTFRPARPFPHVERRHSRDKPIMTMLSPLMLALVAMFLQQSFSILAQGVIPLVAPAALPDLGVPTDGRHRGLATSRHGLVSSGRRQVTGWFSKITIGSGATVRLVA